MNQAHRAATLSDPAWISSGHALIDEVYAYFEQEMSGGATIQPPLRGNG